jgi:hypothetical protein
MSGRMWSARAARPSTVTSNIRPSSLSKIQLLAASGISISSRNGGLSTTCPPPARLRCDQWAGLRMAPPNLKLRTRSRTSREAGSTSRSPTRRRPAATTRPHSPQDRAHPADQLRIGERLDHGIITAEPARADRGAGRREHPMVGCYVRSFTAEPIDLNRVVPPPVPPRQGPAARTRPPSRAPPTAAGSAAAPP